MIPPHPAPARNSVLRQVELEPLTSGDVVSSSVGQVKGGHRNVYSPDDMG